MSDLASLMKYAPGSAAYMMGQNNRQSQQSEVLKQQELKQLIAAKLQEMQQNQQMNPLKLENQGLVNAGLRAEMPGKAADSQLKELSAQFTNATQPTAIQATNSKNLDQVDKDKHEMIGRFQDWATKTGVSLEGTPPLLRKQTLIERMQAGGINLNNPMAQNLLKELNGKDPSVWPAYFTELSDKLGAVAAKQNPQYRASTENSVRQEGSARYTADRHLEGQKYSADRAADSRVEAAKLRMSKDSKNVSDIAKNMGYEKAAVYSSFKAMEAETKEEKDMWENRAAAYQEAHLKGKREAAAGRPNPEGVGIGTVEPQVPNLGPKAASGAQVGPPGSATNPIKLK